MPRGPRKRSNSGIYHIMLRGTNKQKIFQDEKDYQTFLEGLRKYHKLCDFQLFAYCLMSNHLHLLLCESAQGDPVDKIMRRLGTWYVYRYNRRYERSGTLFEGRYKSAVIENDNSFLAALRYIHRIPVKAGIITSPAHYHYSSYASYLADETDELVDTQVLRALIPKDEVAAWHQHDDKADCLDVTEQARRMSISDEKAVQVMKKACNTVYPEVFLQLPDIHRVSAIQQMRKAGASLNQIVRLTGTSMAMVRKAIG